MSLLAASVESIKPVIDRAPLDQLLYSRSVFYWYGIFTGGGHLNYTINAGMNLYTYATGAYSSLTSGYYDDYNAKSTDTNWY